MPCASSSAPSPWRRFPGLIFHAGILALRCFRGPQGLADKRLAQNQPCLGDVVERKHGFDGFAWLCIAAIERQYGTSAFAFDLANTAAEALAPANAGRHLDPCFPRKSAPEIRDADERTIDPRRGNFEAIGPFYRILDIEDGRESRAHDFAIIEVHRPVGTFRHDLHRHSRLRRKLDPDQPVSETGQNRLRKMRHTRGNPGFLDQARFIEDALRLRLHGHCCRDPNFAGPSPVRSGIKYRGTTLPPRRSPKGNKKERVPRGPLSIERSFRLNNRHETHERKSI